MSIEPMGPLIVNLFLDGPMKGSWVPGYKEGQFWIEMGWGYRYVASGVADDVSISTWSLTESERARFEVERKLP